MFQPKPQGPGLSQRATHRVESTPTHFDKAAEGADPRNMSDPTHSQLLQRIAELENEVKERELDLKRFREELGRANGKLEKLIERLHNELKLAQVVQKALVPTEFPHISGFEFSTKFIPSSVSGGDYFDIFEHQDRFRFGVILSSSTGHTMSALLLSVMLKMTGQLEAKRGSAPDQVLVEMYEQLKEHITADDRADIFYSLVDRRNFEMKYVRCGQVLALYQNSSTGEVTALDPGPGPLGLDFPATLKSSSLSLNPRDRMILCTRGVMEAKNPAGETYGVERVTRSFLSGPKRGVHELRNHVLYEIQKFSQTPDPVRDQTLVVLEVKDKVIKLAKG